MALTILQIVRDLAEREPDVVAADPAVYRRRLATCHFNVACAFAEDDRPRALRELGRALRRGLMTPAMLRVSLRILLPSTAIRWMRRLKQAADAWVGYFAWSRRSQISRQ